MTVIGMKKGSVQLSPSFSVSVFYLAPVHTVPLILCLCPMQYLYTCWPICQSSSIAFSIPFVLIVVIRFIKTLTHKLIRLMNGEICDFTVIILMNFGNIICCHLSKFLCTNQQNSYEFLLLTVLQTDDNLGFILIVTWNMVVYKIHHHC